MDNLSREESERFLDDQTIGRLGCHHQGVTYVVPLIYAREGDALYVLTMEGQKVLFARQNPSVCFEVDEYDAATGNWRSVIVQGRYEELDSDGKARAIAILGKRHGSRRGSSSTDGPPPPPPRPVVAFCIRVEHVTGRVMKRS